MVVSLGVSLIVIVALYAKPIYQLYTTQGLENTLLVKSGKENRLIPFDEIGYFYSIEKTVYLVKKDGSRVVTDFTLNQLEEMLNESVFFRVSRQCMAHFQSIARYASLVNGKLELELVPQFQGLDSIVISRYKAKEFKHWIEGKVSL